MEAPIKFRYDITLTREDIDSDDINDHIFDSEISCLRFKHQYERISGGYVVGGFGVPEELSACKWCKLMRYEVGIFNFIGHLGLPKTRSIYYVTEEEVNEAKRK